MWLNLFKCFKKPEVEIQPKVEEQSEIKVMDYDTYSRQKLLAELYQELCKELETQKAIKASCLADCDGSVVPSLDGSDSTIASANEKIRECERKIWLILVSMK